MLVGGLGGVIWWLSFSEITCFTWLLWLFLAILAILVILQEDATLFGKYLVAGLYEQ